VSSENQAVGPTGQVVQSTADGSMVDKSTTAVSMRSLLKRAFARLHLYRLAAGLYETYRLVAKPHTHGALVAIWWQGRVLLVETSYRRELSLPGGGIEAGETPLQAAIRELEEEVVIQVAPQELQDPWQLTEMSAGGQNTVTIFAWHPNRQPEVMVAKLLKV
jgi:8-oxo-dGTP diphosphatase